MNNNQIKEKEVVLWRFANKDMIIQNGEFNPIHDDECYMMTFRPREIDRGCASLSSNKSEVELAEWEKYNKSKYEECAQDVLKIFQETLKSTKPSNNDYLIALNRNLFFEELKSVDKGELLLKNEEEIIRIYQQGVNKNHYVFHYVGYETKDVSEHPQKIKIGVAIKISCKYFYIIDIKNNKVVEGDKSQIVQIVRQGKSTPQQD